MGKLYLLLAALQVNIALAQQTFPVNSSTATVTDVDGNTYKTVVIGYQTWMAGNLKTTKFSDGTPISNIKSADDWLNSTSPAYSWYNNNSESKKTYGALYNGYVISRDICPTGWKVPVGSDWEELQTFLGNNYNIGGKLKETGFKHWNAPNYFATNSSGFTALPGGIRNPYDGQFYDLKNWGYWWHGDYSSESGLPYFMALNNEDRSYLIGATEASSGLSIRCIKEGSDSVPPLVRGLMAYYPFNGNTNDESGNGHHGTANDITFVADRFGNANSAVSIAGGGNSLSFSGYQLSGPTTTLTFWVKPTQETTDTILVNTIPQVLKMTLRVVNKHYQLELEIAGNKIIMSDTRGWSNCDPQRPRFDFISISYNEESIDFVVNNRKLSEYYLPAENLNFKFPVSVKQNPTFTFKGILDDLRIYQRSIHGSVMAMLNTDRLADVPVVTADSISLLGRDYALIHSTVNVSTVAEPLETGVCWSTSPNPDTTHNKAIGCCGDVDIKTNVSGLSPNTTYYVRAYAVDNNGIGYSNELAFTTLPALEYGSVTDIDGNTYKTIQIGTQTWMAENLKTTKYADGTPIQDGTLAGSEDGKYYYVYDNDPEYKKDYGLLYTWLAATNSENGNSYPQGIQGACPAGWHIPTYSEKETLINYLGGPEVAGRKLKESGFAHWNVSPESATDESGFTALGAGMRYSFSDGEAFFSQKNAITFYWTSEAESDQSPVIYLTENNPASEDIKQPINFGGSVRCIQNENALQPIIYGDVDSNTLVQFNDALLTLKYSVGLDPMPKTDPLPWEDWRVKVANVDTKNGVTAYDAYLILLRAANLIKSFPADDAKKSLGEISADVNLALEDGFIVVRATGELHGLNISILNGKDFLGEPQILDTTVLSEVNISSNSYRIGLASAKALSPGVDILKIPILNIPNEQVTVNMSINATERQYSFSSPTSVPTSIVGDIEVYPNPVTDVLYFRNVSENVLVSVFDLSGKELVKTIVTDGKLNVAHLSEGVYVIHITDGANTIVKKVVRQ